MALVPAGMANAQGAVLNVYPWVTYTPPVPIALSDNPVLLVIPFLELPPSQDSDVRIYNFEVGIEVTIGNYNPATSNSSVVATIASMGQPFNIELDYGQILPIQPLTGPSQTSYVLSSRFEIVVADSKALYLSISRVVGDTSTYTLTNCIIQHQYISTRSALG